MKAMKLSQRQREVIEKMAAGWVCRSSEHASRPHAWLTNETDGTFFDIHAGTFAALYTMELVECVERKFPVSQFRLTAAGKAAAAEFRPL